MHKPTALPTYQELARRRQRRAERRRQQQEPAPPWPPAGLELPDAQVLEAASTMLVAPAGSRLVPTEANPQPGEPPR